MYGVELIGAMWMRGKQSVEYPSYGQHSYDCALGYTGTQHVFRAVRIV